MSRIDPIKRLELIRSGRDRQKSLLRTNIILLIALLVLIFLMPVIPVDVPLLSRILLSLVVVSGLFAADFSSSLFRILLYFAIVVVGVSMLGLFLYEVKLLYSLFRLPFLHLLH